MTRSAFARVPGIRVEAVGDGWAAFSPLAGSTHLLNDSSAAVLDVLTGAESMTPEAVAAAVARDVGLPSPTILEALTPVWSELLGAGLVREALEPPDTVRA